MKYSNNNSSDESNFELEEGVFELEELDGYEEHVLGSLPSKQHVGYQLPYRVEEKIFLVKSNITSLLGICREDIEYTVNRKCIIDIIDKVTEVIEDFSLMILVLSDMDLTNQEIEKLIDAVAHSENLVELDLSNNELDDESAEMIAQMLKKNSSLMSLNISGNKFTCKGKTTITEVLLQNSHLTHLSIGEQDEKDDRKEEIKYYATLPNLFKKNHNILYIDDYDGKEEDGANSYYARETLALLNKKDHKIYDMFARLSTCMGAVKYFVMIERQGKQNDVNKIYNDYRKSVCEDLAKIYTHQSATHFSKFTDDNIIRLVKETRNFAHDVTTRKFAAFDGNKHKGSTILFTDHEEKDKNPDLSSSALRSN